MEDEDKESPAESKDDSEEKDVAAEEEKPVETAEEPAVEEKTNSEKPKEPKEKAEKTKSDKPAKPAGTSRWQRFRFWYGSHKKWSIPATVVILLAIVFGIPWSRYHSAALVYKKDFTVQAVDSTTNSPVSGVTVSAGSLNAQTDANGKAKLHLSVGQHTVSFSKKYYQDRSASVLVPILNEKKIPAVAIQATGRQVKISVTNVITKHALGNVQISIADVQAKTDDSGNAVVVLPAGMTKLQASLSLDGYNDAKVTVQISDSEIKQNNFTMTPSGKVYFISKRTGKLNVMKTDLDGTNAQVVLAGTGVEQESNTQLLASPDGKYVALLTQRVSSDPGPQVYMISASDDKLLNVDSGNSDFSFEGWIGDNLVYSLGRNDIPNWQPNKFKLKAYDATSGKITLLDQTTAVGDVNGYANEFYSTVRLISGSVIYAKEWGFVSDDTLLNGKQNTLSAISADGTNHKVVATFDAASTSIQYTQHSSNSLYVWEQNNANAANDQFFDYVVGSPLKAITLTDAKFYQNYPTYAWSSSGKQVLWGEPRDGKTAIMVSDGNGDNSKTIASLSDYVADSWYGDQYVLLTKTNSVLYIMSSSGGTPLKVTEYQPTYLSY